MTNSAQKQAESLINGFDGPDFLSPRAEVEARLAVMRRARPTPRIALEIKRLEQILSMTGPEGGFDPGPTT